MFVPDNIYNLKRPFAATRRTKPIPKLELEPKPRFTKTFRKVKSQSFSSDLRTAAPYLTPFTSSQ